jgi:hypothetical protein
MKESTTETTVASRFCHQIQRSLGCELRGPERNTYNKNSPYDEADMSS